MPSPTVAQIAKAKKAAENGVEYSPQYGARCPWCDSRAKILRTFPWQANTRLRYHRCQKTGCVVANLRLTIKSVETDLVSEKDEACQKI